ncbi:ATP-binding protein [Streptomyces sp. NBC_01190]|uniref:ATP-binding protein n=1 Tax=Streptomyces sp. NBC_01190 TaxID=2903767 RepID=UPI00386ED954|nr:ATP-binding protein [Streptomyces sp. NBC_01190]
MNDVPTADPFAPPEAGPTSALRLLPWPGAEGQPAFLSSNGGFLAELADEIEDMQLDSAKDVLNATHVVTDNPAASADELRFAARRLGESLRETLQVALSRELRGHSMADQTVLVAKWPHDPKSVGRARRELRRALETWGLAEWTDRAELVLSELFSNSVRHVRSPEGSPIETRYERLPGGLRIEVRDAGAELPVLQKPSADAESGYGLGLVEMLTDGRWGAGTRDGVAGKVTWAVVADEDADEQPKAAEEKGGL